jgi:beta-glucosidase
MDGRTYRFFKGEPLFPFGHGLSYTRFEYSALTIPTRVDVGAAVQVSVAVRNAGARDGDEVVQLYVTHLGSSMRVPIRSLQGIKRIHLKRGEQQTVSFALAPKQLAIVNDTGQVRVEPGRVLIAVGGKQPGFKAAADATTTQVVTAETEMTGQAITLVP